MKSLNPVAVLCLSLMAVLAAYCAASPPARVAPTVPLAPGAKEGELATIHYRLVLEEDIEGFPSKRTPTPEDLAFYKANGRFFSDPNECAKAGSKAPPPPPTILFLNKDFLLRCLPYRDGEDSLNTTPIPQRTD